MATNNISHHNWVSLTYGNTTEQQNEYKGIKRHVDIHFLKIIFNKKAIQKTVKFKNSVR